MQHLTRIASDQVDSALALRFSLSMLRKGPLLPLQLNESGLKQVVVPDQGEWPWYLMDDIRREAGVEIEPILAPRDVIMLELNRVFDMASTSAEQMLETMQDAGDLGKEIEELGDLLDAENEAPVIRLVNTLITQALKDRASDIHIEPFESKVVVRFRVDGVLHTVVSPPKTAQSAITSRIKVMAALDIAEKKRPQDGRFQVRIAGRDVDVRVSLLPTASGERVVMRLLDRGSKVLSLKELGMTDSELDGMKKAISAPHGIVLLTGPTGSGKTTTLYAALMNIDRENCNVLTIEDPIEYQLDGVGQMQAQPKIGVTFAAGLRSILRQDPDVVMVGEIRDLETAEIAVQASLTGHLVFSTLHTNDALSAIVRLQDMGIESYLIASSLVMVQAQRLVRKLCPDCKKCRELDGSDIKVLGLSNGVMQEGDNVYDATGCDHCMDTGYYGRIGVYESILISDVMRQAVQDGKGLPTLRKIAAKEQMYTLRQDGVRHVKAGVTSIDEVLRVSRMDYEVVEA